MNIILLIILLILAIFFICFGFICAHNEKEQNQAFDDKLKALKAAKGRYLFNANDKWVFSSLPCKFVFQDVYSYYSHSRTRTALRYWRKYGLIIKDSKNVYHKTEEGKKVFVISKSY